MRQITLNYNIFSIIFLMRYDCIDINKNKLIESLIRYIYFDLNRKSVSCAFLEH